MFKFTISAILTFQIIYYVNALPVQYLLSAPSAEQYITSGNIQFESLKNNDIQSPGRSPSYVQHFPHEQAAKIAQIETDEHAPPKYQFRYEVEDAHTGDVKYHSESRDGDQIRGEYSFKEADGSVRTVKYIVNGKSGFKAVVIKSGAPKHPQGEVNKAERLVTHGQNYYKGYK